MSTTSANKLMLAMEICMDIHGADRDRRGMPFVFHPIRVMDKQDTVECKIIALLHDALENHPERICAEDVCRQFGPAITASIVALTRAKDEDWDAYIQRVIQDANAAKVKLADLEDNMHPRRMDEKSAQKTHERYLAAYKKNLHRVRYFSVFTAVITRGTLCQQLFGM